MYTPHSLPAVTTRIAGTAESIHCDYLFSRFGLAAVMEFTVTMAVAGEKEPPIAHRAAIRVLKQDMAKEPIFDAASSGTEELFAATMGTTRDVRLRIGLVHGEILGWGRLCYNV